MVQILLLPRDGGINSGGELVATHILLCFWYLRHLRTADGLASAGDAAAPVRQTQAWSPLGRPPHATGGSLAGGPRRTRHSLLQLQSGRGSKQRREGWLGTSPCLSGKHPEARSGYRGSADICPSAPPNDHPVFSTGKKDLALFFEKASAEGSPEDVTQEGQAHLLLGYENAGEIAF
jgi:hypothetical protein